MKITENQKELAQYLVNLNEKAKANGSPFAIVTEVEHWADIGVHSVKDFETYDARCTLWDMYKDVNGFRPRGAYMEDGRGVFEMTLEECDAAIKYLQDGIDAEIRREENEKKQHELRWSEAFEESPLQNAICL